jgi:hypothetical protein
MRRLMLLAVLAPFPALPADADLGGLLESLARPAPATIAFSEARFSRLLTRALTVSGEMSVPEAGTLVRRIDSPYQETMTITSTQVRIEREGEKDRLLPLQRAPEMRGLLQAFGALLAGDRATMEKYFAIELKRDGTSWSLVLRPLEQRVARKLGALAMSGRDAEPRCLVMTPPDGSADFTVFGADGAHAVAQHATRDALLAWCQSG